ncbi:type I polyketide synthase [Salinispora arenicola]|uniref:type I polyketide synthase n=1 Tax=Salinispora arenicola TaxID=168697 RepID=UPI000366F643|nr:type I polyketide synthase [Salinispora arenicola]
MPDDRTLLDYLKWVSADLHDTQERLRELEQAQREPIAVVGMSCRFPGGVDGPDDLWRLVETGTDAVTGFPTDRGWDLDAIADSVAVHEGGFLAGADRFDAGFFGISPREATAMDPQQRLLLEGAWEALESAGIDPRSLRGTRTGVFVGSNNQDHVIVLSSATADTTGQGLTGATASVLSGRVSYVLGLEGPALTIDTACSSSLVSLHLAVQSLRRGECSMALAGGVALMATPAMFLESSGQGVLALDGRCKAYAEGADGTGWGEGVGWVLVQRLSDAVREGRRVLAVVTGTAVNQDGASNGLTAPSGIAQRRVIRAALDDAGLSAADVDAVEGHGTGTALGDPIEVGALLETYGREHAAERPLWLGSLKSNIGHTQAAAGIGGIIKMIQAIRHGILPGTLHASQRTSRVEWDRGGLALLTEATPWPETGAPRRAGVSSFGISGTNAHVILEQAPPREAAEPEVTRTPGLLLWVLSGHTEEALRGQARRLLTYVEDNPQLSATDIAWSLATTRSRLAHRAVVLGADRPGLLRGLADLARGEPSAAVVQGTAHFGDKVVFVFPGYGSQWRGMALELIEQEPAFRDEFLACEAAFLPWLGWSSVAALRGDPEAPDLEEFATTQVLLFIVMVALAALWRSYGLEPSGVIGHSQGEIAAAYVAGAVTREDAARYVVARARLMQQHLDGRGGMVAIQLSADELRERLTPYGDRLALAAINGPCAVVMSGEDAALDELAGQLVAEGVRVHKLALNVAAHSAQLDAYRAEIEEMLATLRPVSSDVPFFSTVTGGQLDTVGLDAGHWFSNLRQTVLFEQATRTALTQGYRLMLEVSAHPVVAMAVQDVIDDTGIPAIPLTTLRRGEGGRDRFLRALAEAHVQGAPVDFGVLFGGTGARRVALPTYAFQHERFRLDPGPTTGDASSLGLTPLDHPLVTAAIALPEPSGQLLTGRLTRRTHPWLADHIVLGAALLPGTAHLELAFRAGDQVGCDTVEELTLQTPLTLPEHDGVALQVFVGGPQDDGRRSVAVWSRRDTPDPADDGDEWTCHATGLLGHAAATPVDGLTSWPPAAAAVDIDGLYERLSAAGYGYGPAFRGLRSVWSDGGDIYAEVTLPEETVADAGRFGLHPALLDAAFHALIAARPPQRSATRLLFSWAGVRLVRAGASALRIRLRPRADGTVTLLAADVAGTPVATADALVMREVTETSLIPDPARELFREQLQPLAVPRQAADEPVIWTDPGGLLESLTEPGTRYAVFAAPTPPGVGVVAAARQVTERLRTLLSSWLTSPGAESTTLVIRTRNARSGSPDPVQAAGRGVVRSFQASHPGRILVLDTASADEPVAAVISAALAAEEDDVVLHDETAMAARLVRVPAGDLDLPWSGTVLVTGDAGTRAAEVARHVAARGAARVVLAGAGEPDHAGVEAVACDLTDADALAALVADVAPDVVLHAAETGDPVATAWALDRAATSVDLRAFVLFSTADGVLGGAGRAERSAASAFTDALVRRRRATGRVGQALAWGSWASTAGGLALLDAAVVVDEAVVVPFRPRARGNVPPLLRSLVRAPLRPTVDAVAQSSSALARRIGGLDPAERVKALVELVQSEAAVVLGFADVRAVPATRAFRDIGFVSMNAVELRNRLTAVTGLPLAATVVFDHPSAVALGTHLGTLLLGGAPAETVEPVTDRVVDEPIAVIGMSCRFPGDVRSPEDLWRLVADGVDATGDLPGNRGWNVDSFYDPAPGQPGRSYVRRGGFVRDADRFDAGFFGINPREALAMDPQQRLLLETAWEGLEHAGLDPATLRGSDTGVFVGSNGQDHALVLSGAVGELSGYRLTGTSASIMSGRISYEFGFEGPALTVDTACSSSLVSLHLAAEALRGGECSLALAGGCSIICTPTQFVEFSMQNALSPDGRSRAFSAGSNGFGMAEGVGWLVLERLSEARRHGHPVLAVVRGSAVNQDGASNGLTAPNGPSQERVIRQALASAGLTPADVDAVEAHGTGTPLGDPIEATALLNTYGRDRTGPPLLLGSLKSNFGHAQAAAGVGGVIKSVMALRAGVLPPTLHADEPTPQVDWSSGGVQLLTERRDWPRTDRPRRVGVSGFGISGTNAHVILEQAPDPPADGSVDPEGDLPTLWTLSAPTLEALRAQASRLRVFVDEHPELSPHDIGRSLVESRSAFDHRAALVGRTRAELLQGLTALANGESAATLVEGRAVTGGGVVFVFPGQGSQWAGMAAELFDSSEIFAEEFRACSLALSEWIDWSPVDVLRKADEALLGRVDVVQPMLWAVMVSLAALWRSYGVEPAAVVGHSQGEIAAACAIGVLSRDDAAKVVAVRSQALTRISGSGGMMSVQLGRAVLEPRMLPWGGRISVAAVNSPRSVVVSGEVEALQELHAALVADGVSARLIAVDYAAHSAQVDQIQDELADLLATVRSVPAHVPFYSCVEGDERPTNDLDAGYWHRNLRETVLFEDSIKAALARGHRLVLEASPHPVLVTAVQDVLDDSGVDAHSWGTLRRSAGGLDRFLLSLAQAHVNGAEIDFGPLFAGARLISLPTYAFQGERFWIDAAAPAGDASSLGLVAAGHPMLAAEVPLSDSGALLLTGRLSVHDQTWLGDHVVSGMTIVPGTAFMEIAFKAAERVGCPRVEELAVQAPLLLDPDVPTALQVVIAAPLDTGQRQLTVYARPEPAGDGLDEDWTLHATCWLTTATPAAPDTSDLLVWPPRDTVPFAAQECYRQLVAAGYAFGPTFQGLREVHVRGKEVFALVSIPAEGRADAAVFGLHPALFDAMFHSLISARPQGSDEVLRLPFTWTGVQLHAEGAVTMRVKMTLTSADSLTLVAVDESGGLVVSADALLLREISGAGAPTAASRRYRSLYRLEWAPLVLRESVPGESRWAVLGDSPVAVSLTRHDSSVRRHDDWSSLAVAERVPDLVVLPVDTLGGSFEGTDVPRAARRLLIRVTGLVQDWLADERFADSRLLVVTRQAVPAGAGEPLDIVQSPLWGLLRSAQSENPDRLLLVDLDDDDTSLEVLPRAVAAAVAADEFQVLVRAGKVFVARLGLVSASEAEQAPTLHPDGTVLITGASGLLAGHLARHLAGRGVRRLLLLSRRGERARTTAPLVAELAALGARATVVACDTADRAALADVLAAIPTEHPLTGVVHAAGVLRDGTVATLNPDQLDVVLRPKIDSVWNLHELTADADLALFAMFSSAAGTLGGSGQGAYAAANVFLDSLAARRRSLGLPATSLAWGAWEASADPGNRGMAGNLASVDAGRARRGGLLPFTFAQGMALFDTAVGLDEAFVLPMRMDLAGVRASGGPVPSLLRALVKASTRRTAEAVAASPSSLRDRFGELSGEDRERYAIDLVRGQAAAVLGHVSAQLVPADEAFRDLGFDSLTAVELRNRLKTTTGLSLPATLVFDHPNPRALARFLLTELMPGGSGPVMPAQAELDRLEAALAAAPVRPGDDAVAERLSRILSGWLRNRPAAEPVAEPEAGTDLGTATTDEIFAYIDNVLGRNRA